MNMPRSETRKIRGLYVLGPALIVISALSWMLLSGPVLVRVHLARAINRPLFNPLRDKTPERAALRIVEGIHSKDCASFMATLPTPLANAKEICGRQFRDPLTTSCVMVDYEGYKDAVWIAFKCTYQRGGDATADVAVTFARKSIALEQYERIY